MQRRDVGFAAGVGLTLISLCGPALGIPVPYPIVIIGFAIGVVIVLWSIRPVTLRRPNKASIAAIVDRLLGRKRIPIMWKLDDPLGMQKTQEGTTVGEFRAWGENTSDASLSGITSFIRSDITNKQIPVGFVINGQIVSPNDTDGIPPKSKFLMAAKFPIEPPNVSGMTLERFMLDFAAFTFVFQCNDQVPFTRSFSVEDIEGYVTQYQRRLREAAGGTPGVRRSK